jgi:hypothetical protein
MFVCSWPSSEHIVMTDKSLRSCCKCCGEHFTRSDGIESVMKRLVFCSTVETATRPHCVIHACRTVDRTPPLGYTAPDCSSLARVECGEQSGVGQRIAWRMAVILRLLFVLMAMRTRNSLHAQSTERLWFSRAHSFTACSCKINLDPLKADSARIRRNRGHGGKHYICERGESENILL